MASKGPAKSMLSKQINKLQAQKRGGKLMASAKKMATGKGGNGSKVGEATAKRMLSKVQERKEKRRSKAMDEDIDSDIADDIEMDEAETKQRKTNAISNDPFFMQNDQAND